MDLSADLAGLVLDSTSTPEPVTRSCSGGSSIDWPRSLAVSYAMEATMVNVLADYTIPTHMHVLQWDLPADAQADIEAHARRCGFTLRQAYSLRRGCLKCAMGMKPFMSIPGQDQAKAETIAEAFELCVETFLRANVPASTVITTEAQRKQHALASGTSPGPTPDFTLSPPVRINGRPVAWIDAKMLYASYTLRDKRFMPESKMAATAHKYNFAFGPGAFVVCNGFCTALAREVPALMLDASPLDTERLHAVIEGHCQVATPLLSTEAMRTALGLAERASVQKPKKKRNRRRNH